MQSMEEHGSQAFDPFKHKPNGELAHYLMDTKELAYELDVSLSTIRSWRRRHKDFPKPLKRLTIGPVWWGPEVFEWAKNR